MGRTLPSITQVFQMEERETYLRFWRGLRRSDQQILEDLFSDAQHHLAEAAYAASDDPQWIFMLSMLLEERKLLLQLKARLDVLESPHGLPDPPEGSLFSDWGVG